MEIKQMPEIETLEVTIEKYLEGMAKCKLN